MPAKNILLIFGTLSAVGFIAKASVGQTVVSMPQLVIEQQRMELVSPTRNAASANLINVTSSNPGVARVYVYRVNQVQIVAVAPGRTDVSFFDTKTRLTYKLPVWVQAANASGGGTGYNPRLAQLPQIVMLVQHTQNVTSPANAPHNINGVKSSNPSVATARTNTADTIQIYSQALGDTFIEFTDNGVTYQVHVWVQNSLNGSNGGSGGSGGSNPRPNPTPTPKPKPNPGPGPKTIAGPLTLDQCLVGTWISGLSTEMDGKKGMSGIVLTIKADRNVTVDYSAMQPSQFIDSLGRIAVAQSWSGVGTGHIATSNGVILVRSQEGSNVTHTITSNGRTKTNTVGSLAPLLGSQPYIVSYTCEGNNLTISPSLNGMTVDQFNFTRRE